jgi:hypothetical protein
MASQTKLKPLPCTGEGVCKAGSNCWRKNLGKNGVGKLQRHFGPFGCRSWVSMGEFRCGDNVIYFDLISDLPGNQIKI